MTGFCLYCKKSFRKRESSRRYCSVTCSNRHHLNRLKIVTLPKHCKELAEFIGICLGDGYVSKYQVAVTLNAIADREYIIYVKSLMLLLFPESSISIVEKKGDNAIDVRINSSMVAKFLYEMGIVPNAKKVPRWVAKDIEFSLACIKGLIDTEGSISFKKYSSKTTIRVYKQLNFRNVDVELMRFVRDTLMKIGLRPTTTLKKSLYISNNNGILIYRDRIGFGNPKHLLRSSVTTIEDFQNLLT